MRSAFGAKVGGSVKLHYVYIIFSKELNKYYAGETSDLDIRIGRHGKDRTKFTGKAQDWKLIWSKEVSTRTEALKIEKSIKNRGIKRFLEDNKIEY